MPTVGEASWLFKTAEIKWSIVIPVPKSVKKNCWNRFEDDAKMAFLRMIDETYNGDAKRHDVVDSMIKDVRQLFQEQHFVPLHGIRRYELLIQFAACEGELHHL